MLTSIPRTLWTPYMWYNPHTISLITVFRPGHRPPHVTIHACTSSDSKYTWETFKTCTVIHNNMDRRISWTLRGSKSPDLLTRSSTTKMCPSWTILRNNNLYKGTILELENYTLSVKPLNDKNSSERTTSTDHLPFEQPYHLH